jgi:alkaline phosphatase D
MKFDRRQTLALLGAGTATASCAAADATLPAAAFLHGVASGDPLSDRVILWTAISGPQSAGRNLYWTVAEDPDFARVVRKGRARTGEAGTVKVDVTGLKPGRDYWYRFHDGAQAKSPVGRTRTLPEGPTPDAVIAVASCSLWAGGFFNAYEALAALPRVDAVVHLGDYIYEYGPDGFGADIGPKIGRLVDPPHECLTLADYRRRHAQAKSDPKLQAAHARAPWIIVWDDHETANDAWTGGAENHTPATEGGWSDRKAAGLRAWYEWMPIREKPGQPFEAINRTFHFGDLASLIMVETRLTARAHQIDYAADLMVDGKPAPQAFAAKLMDPARTMMGERQEAWLAGELASSVQSGRRWQVLGNQVVMARVTMPDVRKSMGEAAYATMAAKLPDYAREPVEQAQGIAALGLPYNLDAWDGYPVARERFYEACKLASATPIVLSGDSHAFWANELWDAGGQNRVGAEFGATGISSPGFGDVLVGAPFGQAFTERNKEVRYTDHAAKGFIVLTLTRQAAVAEMVAVSTVYAPQYQSAVLKRFRVEPALAGVGAVTEIS